MAGIKEVTPGFAYECFGKLYLEANRKGARIQFSDASEDVGPILLSGVEAALR
jgi:hypothetical protein